MDEHQQHTHDDTVDELEPVGRRGFLRLGFMGTGAALAQVVVARRADARIPIGRFRLGTCPVFRLSARGVSCAACGGHALNKYFRSHRAANMARAHPGCNCPVVVQWIPIKQYTMYFRRGAVYDVRWGKKMTPVPLGRAKKRSRRG